MEFQTKFSTVKLPNGETYAYREAGDSLNSKVLICLHGSLEGSRVFTHIVPYLSESFRIIAVDLRAHGHSSYNRELESLSDFTEDIKEFCDVLGFRKAYFFGRGIGGCVSLTLAANYPEYVEGIILHSFIGLKGTPCYKVDESGKDTSVRTDSREECMTHPHATLLRDIVAKQNARLVGVLIQTRNFLGKAKPTPEELQERVEDYLVCKCSALIVLLVNFFNITTENNGACQGTGEICKVQCPVLILHGAKNVIIPCEEAKITKKWLGDKAELKLFPEGAHMLSNDFPEEVSDLMKKFCRV